MEGQPDRPDAVQLQISRLVVTNRRMEEKMAREDLKAAIDQYTRAKLFTSPEFPNNKAREPREMIPVLMSDHADAKDNPYIDQSECCFLQAAVFSSGAVRMDTQYDSEA